MQRSKPSGHHPKAPFIPTTYGRPKSIISTENGMFISLQMMAITIPIGCNAVENTSEDPFEGTFEFKGKIAADTDTWAIDGNVFRYKGPLYMIWSGWKGDANGQQDIFIAKMKNPLEIEGERVKISSPSLEWEKHWDTGTSLENPPEVFVNDGTKAASHN